MWLWLLVTPLVVAQDIAAVFGNPANNWSVDTTFYLPSESAFVNLTERWTVVGAPTYSAAISPSTEEDLVNIVTLATQNNVQFLATGGRHSVSTTLASLQNGLAVDLSQFDQVLVSSEDGTLTIGGGVRLEQILDPVYNAGFEMQQGSCSCPAYVGVTIGGGIGRYTGVYGLAIDSLLSVRLVTADGRLLTVSENSYPDLFWAVRGAGANFGVVVSATYELRKISDDPVHRGHVFVVDVSLPANTSSAYFNLLESYHQNGSLPSNLAQISALHWDEGTNASVVLGNWAYMGSVDEGREILAPVLGLEALEISARTVPWDEVIASQGFGEFDAVLCEDNKIRHHYAATVRNVSASAFEIAFEKLTKFLVDYPDARGTSMQIETFPNQAAMAVADESTAYPWRDAVAHIALVFTLDSDNATTVDAVTKLGPEIRNDIFVTSGYPDLAVYLNYAHGDEPIESLYGRNKLPRLAELKGKWDPNNVFSFHHALPTSYP
ncbi:Uu.00g130590.m01.CDS01 [Anthostomella pinea]|uniref:Uu.00g130590.m01.CDS01 n=1 Tax=Anthostomella pinea TaxID=933095 RepID=A0AAI8VJN6_9PEZI|nr:Uu.00g130590.m01.CDS01 [Anthostomella pinea]